MLARPESRAAGERDGGASHRHPLDGARCECHIVQRTGHLAHMRNPKPRQRRKPSSPPAATPAGLAEKGAESYSAEGPIVDVISPDRRPNVPVVRATPGALADLNRHGYSDEEIWALVAPKRTLARRVAKREPLAVEETDRALQLERVATLA